MSMANLYNEQLTTRNDAFATVPILGMPDDSTLCSLEWNVTAMTGTAPSLLISLQYLSSFGGWADGKVRSGITALGYSIIRFGPGIYGSDMFLPQDTPLRLAWVVGGSAGQSATFQMAVNAIRSK